jgi:hypothetical protein
MKRLTEDFIKCLAIFILFFCYISNVYSSDQNISIEICAEYNINGRHTADVEGTLLGEYISSSGEEEVENSLTPSLQFGAPITKNIEVGVGVKYQMPRRQKDFEGNFTFIPAYFFIRVSGMSNEHITPYVTGQLGYNHFIGDDDYKGVAILSGKHYYGLGLGLLLLNHINLGALYSVNSGAYKLDYLNNDLEGDIRYSKISLFMGFKGCKK